MLVQQFASEHEENQERNHAPGIQEQTTLSTTVAV